MEVAASAADQWDRDLAELLGLDAAADARGGSPTRQVGGGARLSMLAATALAVSIAAFVLVERRSEPPAAPEQASVARRDSGASRAPVAPPVRSPRAPANTFAHDDEVAARVQPPAPPVPAPAVVAETRADRPAATVAVAAKPPRATMAAATAGRAGARRTASATAPRNARRIIAGDRLASLGIPDAPEETPPIASAVSDRSVARSTAPASPNRAGDAGRGDANPAARLAFQEARPGPPGAGDGVRTPGDKTKPKDKSRKIEAIDAIRLLRRQ